MPIIDDKFLEDHLLEEKSILNLSVDDILIVNDLQNYPKMWKVLSICLGVVNQEDLVELKSMMESPGVDTDGIYHDTTWVPIFLLQHVKCYEQIPLK